MKLRKRSVNSCRERSLLKDDLVLNELRCRENECCLNRKGQRLREVCQLSKELRSRTFLRRKSDGVNLVIT